MSMCLVEISFLIKPYMDIGHHVFEVTVAVKSNYIFHLFVSCFFTTEIVFIHKWLVKLLLHFFCFPLFCQFYCLRSLL